MTDSQKKRDSIVPARKNKADLYKLSDPIARGYALRENRNDEFKKQTAIKTTGKKKTVAHH